MILSVVVVLVYLFASGMPLVFGGVFISFWLTMWTIGVYALLRNVFTAWSGVLRSCSSAAELIGAGKALFLTAFAIPFCFGEVMGFAFLLKMASLSLVLFIFASGILHVLFLHPLKAPTFAGRRLMDQVQGFKMFLGAVDGERLNRAALPQPTPEVFEKFRPYALALDVEQDWAEKFSGVLGAAGAAPCNSAPGYTPSFYSGSGWNGFGATSFASSFSGSFSSAIASSSSAPGSGGGGGSGGSGGGGAGREAAGSGSWI